MVKHNGWEKPILSALILGENFSHWFIKCYLDLFFLSSIKLSIFIPLNHAKYKIGKYSASQIEETTCVLPLIYLLLQDFQNLSRLI